MKISIISNTLIFISKYYNRENSEYRVLFSCMNDQQSIDLKDLNKLFQRFLKIPFFLQTQRKRFGVKDQRGSVSKIFRDERKLVKLINRRQADVRGTQQRGRGRIDRQRANDNNVIHPPLVLHIATRSHHPNESFLPLFSQLSLNLKKYRMNKRAFNSIWRKPLPHIMKQIDDNGIMLISCCNFE